MKWLKHLTPLPMAATALVIVLMNFLFGSYAAEVKNNVALLTLPLAGGCIVADWVLKKALRKKWGWIWISEILLLLVVVYLWIIAE